MDKIGKFLKGVFVDKLWIKIIAAVIAFFVVIMLNV
jgi:hypothetical protein